MTEEIRIYHRARRGLHRGHWDFLLFISHHLCVSLCGYVVKTSALN